MAWSDKARKAAAEARRKKSTSALGNLGHKGMRMMTPAELAASKAKYARMHRLNRITGTVGSKLSLGDKQKVRNTIAQYFKQIRSHAASEPAWIRRSRSSQYNLAIESGYKTFGAAKVNNAIPRLHSTAGDPLRRR